MPAKKNEKTLPIVERALANRIAAHRAGNIGDATDDGRKADLAVKAAYAAPFGPGASRADRVVATYHPVAPGPPRWPPTRTGPTRAREA